MVVCFKQRDEDIVLRIIEVKVIVGLVSLIYLVWVPPSWWSQFDNLGAKTHIIFIVHLERNSQKRLAVGIKPKYHGKD